MEEEGESRGATAVSYKKGRFMKIEGKHTKILDPGGGSSSGQLGPHTEIRGTSSPRVVGLLPTVLLVYPEFLHSLHDITYLYQI